MGVVEKTWARLVGAVNLSGKIVSYCQAAVAHAFNPSTREAEAGGDLCEFKTSLVYKS